MRMVGRNWHRSESSSHVRSGKIPSVGFVEDSELAAAVLDELMPRDLAYDQVWEGGVDVVQGDVVWGGDSETGDDVGGKIYGEVWRHGVMILGVQT